MRSKYNPCPKLGAKQGHDPVPAPTPHGELAEYGSADLFENKGKARETKCPKSSGSGSAIIQDVLGRITRWLDKLVRRVSPRFTHWPTNG